MCFAFGCVLILNIHPVGDGDWFWYARAVRSGVSLYGSLHMPMQPLYVLLTAAGQVCFGNTWIASKILAVLQLGTYCIILYAVCRRIPAKDSSRSTLLITAFCLSIISTYARFDDFHITSHSLMMLAVYLLLRLDEVESVTTRRVVIALLGLACGFSLSNRLNDGALLTVSVILCIYVLDRGRRLAALPLFLVPVAAVPVALIWMTHSSLRDWLQSTVIDAARIKGGSGHLVRGPIIFPITAAHSLLADHGQVYAVVLFAILCLSIVGFLRAIKPAHLRRLSLLIFSSLLASLSTFGLYRLHAKGAVVAALVDGTVVLSYLSTAVWLLYALRSLRSHEPAPWLRRGILLLVPLGAITAGAITSGGAVDEALAPMACGILVLALLLKPSLTRRLPFQVTAFIFTLIVIVCTVPPKLRQPYSWHNFQNGPAFSGRTWYRHPQFGPMYIESRQLALMNGICETIRANGQQPQLLSLPWPYPNYFCAITPWRGYVQTWYDTSSRQTIEGLVTALQTTPPEWIVYQRNPAVFSAHERAFGGSLPHRALDDLITARIAAAAWSLRYQQEYDGAVWMVIQTAPPR